MKLAVDSFSYYMHFGKHWYVPEKPVDIQWYCEISKQLGLDGLHIDPYHADLDRDIEWIGEFSQKNEMYVELGASGTSVNELEPYFIAAKKLNAALIRTFIGGSCLGDRLSITARVKAAKQQLSESVRMAEKYGVKIAVENHGDIFIEDILSLLKIDSDYLGVCFDSGNFSFTDENPLDAIDAFGDRILCTHLKDVCEETDYPEADPFKTITEPVHFCALGDGELPLNTIINKLSDLDIDRMTLEICSPYVKTLSESALLEFEEVSVIKSIGFMRNQ